MANSIEHPTTQRAYTLRLRGIDPQDDSWRDALWATHSAVNKGAKVFGEWLLTLRGGLDHQLADALVKHKGGETRPPTNDDRRDRRILLALSWLSVEDARGAPNDESLIVAKGTDSADCRARKLADALTAILQARGVAASEIGDPSQRPEDQPDTWLGDCMSSLSAAIRDDAVWVNRSKAFDTTTNGWDEQSARCDAQTVLSHLLTDKFLTLPTSTKVTSQEAATDEAIEAEERQSVVKASSKGAGNRTRHLFSHLLGQGKPFGKPSRKLKCRSNWRENIIPMLNAAGIPVADIQNAPRRRRKDGPAHTELQREMFSKAASRVAQIVTKQRQQESDRLARKRADADLRQMEADSSFGDALVALRSYCDEYRSISGATGEFLIRPRQVTGWDRVLTRWSAITETDAEKRSEARVEAVKSLQESHEDEKFGDVNLFFRLAEERFDSIWQRNGTADATILERFVRGMKARSDSERLKVAAYRHPDPYRNPIFCQFGESRPAIHFRRLKKFTEDPAGNDPRAVGLLLWHPACNSARLTVIYGVSQRFDREIGTACDHLQRETENLCAVPRRGRLGTAASGLSSSESPARVAGVFDRKKVQHRSTADKQKDSRNDGDETGKLKEPKWNGTLSADRRELETIGKLIDKGDNLKADRRRKQLRWTLTVSMEMESRGPWFRYVTAAQDQTPFVRTARKDKEDPTKGLAERKGDKRVELEGWPWQEFNQPLKENNYTKALVEDTTAARGNKARLILSRLPGLRVLAVDLGHRYAAACAVWETLSQAQIEAICRDRGASPPAADAMHLHLKRTTDRLQKSGRRKGQPVEETTVYRRIGADQLPDGSPHPAPWARLDRQFLIKLQGEDRPARAASQDEIKAVEDFERWAGRVRTASDPARKRGVDLLMNDAVRTARLALARHGRRARIAHQLTATSRTLPGARQQELDDAGRRELLIDTLADWYALATDSRWRDDSARQLWNERLAPLVGGFQIAPPVAAMAADEPPTKLQRRQQEQALRDNLRPLAQTLAGNESLRRELHDSWCARWSTDDDQWKQKLKWLSRWLMPRGGARRDASRRHVGGLSLTRLSTLTEFRRKVQVGYFTRLRPDGSRAEIGRQFGQSTLDAIQRLKDQRIKQLSSRIVEAALGIGIEQQRVRDKAKQTWRSVERPRDPLYNVDDQGVEHGDRRFQACHAVVIEDLSHYRPEETRTRRENRATMDWKSAETRKRLADHCQLYGLHLRDVNPQYTSRQDSRTGAPGCRCVDVSVADFLTKPWWRKQVAQARVKVQANKGDVRDRLLVELDQEWTTASPTSGATGTLRIPVNGGEIFVSADPNSPLARGIQADLNAAANIGLRALMDPDFPGKWWYVPCDPSTLRPHAEKVKGSILASIGSLQNVSDESVAPAQRGRGRARRVAPREVINLWRDPAAAAIKGVAGSKEWHATPAYWNIVKVRVVNVLRQQTSKPGD